MTVLSAQEERAGDVCSAWGLLSASSSCGQGKEGDLEHEELLGDSTERAEEGVEVAQGGTRGYQGAPTLWFRCPGTDITANLLCFHPP